MESPKNQQGDEFLHVKQRAFILIQVQTRSLHVSKALAQSESLKLCWGGGFYNGRGWGEELLTPDSDHLIG